MGASESRPSMGRLRARPPSQRAPRGPRFMDRLIVPRSSHGWHCGRSRPLSEFFVSHHANNLYVPSYKKRCRLHLEGTGARAGSPALSTLACLYRGGSTPLYHTSHMPAHMVWPGSSPASRSIATSTTHASASNVHWNPIEPNPSTSRTTAQDANSWRPYGLASAWDVARRNRSSEPPLDWIPIASYIYASNTARAGGLGPVHTRPGLRHTQGGRLPP